MTLQADILGTDPKDHATIMAVLLEALNILNYYANTEAYAEPINAKAKEFLEQDSTQAVYWRWQKIQRFLSECERYLEKTQPHSFDLLQLNVRLSEVAPCFWAAQTEAEWIFICSPLKGKAKDIFDMGVNITRAINICREVVKLGFIPVAPHLLFPRYMDELNPEHRKLGIEAGIRLMPLCKELWVFAQPGEESEGMLKEIEIARMIKMPIEYKTDLLEAVA